jgi:3',5'-cyclic AMP phosphodiesterase CpdA
MREPRRGLGRRAFLQRGALLLLGGASLDACARAHLASAVPALRLGLITDLHYADKEPAGTRYYRETIPKLAEAAAKFRAERPDLVVVLGDLIDAASTVEEEWGYLERIQRELSAGLPVPRHFVLGNHCVDTLTKAEFLGGVGQKHSFYAFDAGGHHFVVLDACFRADGVPYQRKNFDWKDTFIPEWELDWLAEDLSRTSLPTIVFAHQRLDLGNEYAVKNAPRVREILERSGRVLAVFQGHSHKNDYREIAGIHYTTLVAMIEGSGAENNGYSVLDVLPGGALRLTGFRMQQSRELGNL